MQYSTRSLPLHYNDYSLIVVFTMWLDSALLTCLFADFAIDHIKTFSITHYLNFICLYQSEYSATYCNINIKRIAFKKTEIFIFSEMGDPSCCKKLVGRGGGWDTVKQFRGSGCHNFFR